MAAPTSTTRLITSAVLRIAIGGLFMLGLVVALCASCLCLAGVLHFSPTEVYWLNISTIILTATWWPADALAGSGLRAIFGDEPGRLIAVFLICGCCLLPSVLDVADWVSARMLRLTEVRP